ncbi:hypothetical protein NPIL_665811, partial [Nephila pilipes]
TRPDLTNPDRGGRGDSR